MLLMIDNYDSFTYNLVQYFGELGQDIKVYRNDAITLDEIEQMQPDMLVISPGPCTPDKAGVTMDAIRRFAGRIPILGVCLGHQAIGQVFGARVIKAAQPVHGKTSFVRHDGRTIYKGIDNPLRVCRYHSLVLEPNSIPDDLEVTATTEDEEIMGIRHKHYIIEGVQFHPEAILTHQGRELLSNFIGMVKSLKR
ncbi:anthranilate synthase component II [Mahella australiensis]|uniref:Glutamine amidotransferase of anthranilate synthase n=1 Tax=Mahella australiensis (strain DSM 15567 / CIP 107919 / 50-1 BON) TaxID=697281 RepID=F4A226_MAHA5|nr:aminodeoxychorismate/anthranilate synthase component II [Mahella australiensis]AEE97165.1 glutamine amidotransferase of anthranilate synthase [Mahella australiensis 50-1 BON]